MRYSEFNKKIADFELQYTESDVFIYCDGVTIGKVDRLQRYTMSTYYEGLSQFPDVYVAKAFEAMAMLAETPLAEREEEKRYRLLKLPIPVLDRSTEKQWLWRQRGTKIAGVDTLSVDHERYQTIFTESEIAKMDITGFEKEPVE